MVRERAQLLLVGSVLIAITIVATVVLLNSVYTPANLQTDDVQGDSEDVEQVHEEVRRALEGLFLEMDKKNGVRTPFFTDSLNPGGNSSTTFQNNVSGELARAYARSLSDRRAGTLDVEYLAGASQTGWAAYQTDGTTYLDTSTPGKTNWTVATGDPDIVRMRLSVYDPENRPFTLKVNDSGSTAWRLNVSEDSVTVNPAAGAERDICDVSGDFDTYETRIEVTGDRGHVEVYRNGILADRCSDFQLAPGVGSPWSVHFIRGGSVNGNYTITGVGGSPGDAPKIKTTNTMSKTVVNPAFKLTYVSSGVTYESTFKLYEKSNT
jgi:hypothetical protein